MRLSTFIKLVSQKYRSNLKSPGRKSRFLCDCCRAVSYELRDKSNYLNKQDEYEKLSQKTQHLINKAICGHNSVENFILGIDHNRPHYGADDQPPEVLEFRLKLLETLYHIAWTEETEAITKEIDSRSNSK